MLALAGQPSYIPMAEARGFTKDLLTVVASRSPLDASQGGPHVEPAVQYLERLGKRLEAYKAQGHAAIAHIRIRTQKSP